MSAKSQALGWTVGVGGALAAGAGMILGLSITPIIAVPIAAVVGLGLGLIAAPLRPAELVRLGITPTSTQQALDAAVDSAKAMRKAVRGLSQRAVWGETTLDEELLQMCDAIEALAAQPAIRNRPQIDGDVQTLFTVATDYMPTIVNLAIENDRMHASFSSGRSQAEIRKNIEGLHAQTLVLGEVIEHIESDVVRGITRDAEQHAEFLRTRFQQTGASDLLNLNVSMPTSPPDPAP